MSAYLRFKKPLGAARDGGAGYVENQEQSEGQDLPSRGLVVSREAQQEYEKKLKSIRQINSLIEQKDPGKLLQEVADVDEFIISNVKSSFKAAANCLSAHLVDPARPSGGQAPARDGFELQQRILFYLGLYLEALKLTNNLLDSLVASEEIDLVDIHFQQINRLLIVLYATIEPAEEGGPNGAAISAKDAEDSRRVVLEIDKLLRKYARVTENIDNIIHIINEHGMDSPDPHIRFRIIQSIPDLVVDTFQKSVNSNR